MANTTIIVTSAEEDWETKKQDLDDFRAKLRQQQVSHSFSEQIRWTWPSGNMVLEYVWRYDFPEGIDFSSLG